jgi:hypothetical protein
MRFFDNFNKTSAAAELVRRGLANREAVNGKQIRDCIYLLENALGETWKKASKQAAAGMVLIALARNKALDQFLNGCGWTLVMSLVQTNPAITRDLASGKRAEIQSYQMGRAAALA